MIDVAAMFPGAEHGVYLNTASMALGNTSGAAALNAAVDEWQQGTFDWVAAEAVGEDLRQVVASLLGVRSDDLAFVTGAAGGASTVAAQLPQGQPGANVVVPARDFASNFLAWQLLQDRGYELRTVEDVEGVLDIDTFAAAIDHHTAVVATSLVQSASGFRVDLDALKTLAQDAGAWLVVDASQALGCVEFDIEGIDALFTCSHKWLLGIRGMAHLYVRPTLRDLFRPLTPGWKSTAKPMESSYGPSIEVATAARKLDFSSPWFDPMVNLAGARIIADIGVADIEAHNTALIDDLESRGFEVPFAASNRSPIVSLPVADTATVVDWLEAENIKASARAGRLRIAVHLYNTHADIDALAATIG